MTTLSESAVHFEMLSERDTIQRGAFIDDLTTYASHHQAQHWRGTFAEFLHDIVPRDAAKFTRSSHQYIYDMLCAYRDAQAPENGESEAGASSPKALFAGELLDRKSVV